MEEPLTKGLFRHNPRIFRWVVDESGGDEVTLRLKIILAANSDLLALLLDLGKETLDTLILHRVLYGPMCHAFFQAVADLGAFDLLHQSVTELVVN